MAYSPPGDAPIALRILRGAGLLMASVVLSRDFFCCEALVLIGANECILRLRHDGLILKE